MTDQDDNYEDDNDDFIEDDDYALPGEDSIGQEINFKAKTSKQRIEEYHEQRRLKAMLDDYLYL